MAVKDTQKPKNTKDAELTSDVYRDEKPSPFSIESIRSGAFSSKIVKGFIILSGLIMAGGFLATSFGPTGQPGGGGPINPKTTVAQVGGESITTGQLLNALAQMEQMNQWTGQTTTAQNYLRGKQDALNRLADNATVILAARNSGITVTNDDINKKIDELIAEQLKPQGQSEAAFRRMIETRFGSLEKAKEQLRSNLEKERKALSDEILVEKLQKQVEESNKVTEDDYKRSVTKLKLWQISIRPDSPKAGVKDIKAETDKLNLKASEEANKLFASLKATPTLAAFKAAALKQSDDQVTKAKGGDIGLKLPSEINYGEGFSDTLAKSGSNLVGPLKDNGGANWIFFIESRKTELPKDYQKNKKKLIEDFEKQKDSEAWTKAKEEYKKGITPQISDPALAAYELQNDPEFYSKTTDEQKKIREDAIERYQSAVKNASGVEAAAIHLQLAGLYRELNQKPQQLVSLENAVKEDPNNSELRLEYARSLREAGQPKVALVQLQEASKALDNAPPSPMAMYSGYDPSSATRQQIAAEFMNLKEPKLAEAERAKIKPATPPQGGGFPGGIQVR
jgi:hypothetical protein